MRLYRHHEEHATKSDTVADIVIGAADGLTVPFALAAGLAGAVAQSRVVLTAGIAEIAAGAIAMGLGGFLAARAHADHYAAERRREEREIIEVPDHPFYMGTQGHPEYKSRPLKPHPLFIGFIEAAAKDK